MDRNKKNNIRPYWGSHPGSQPRKNRSVCIRQLCDLRRSESGGLAIGTLRSPPKYSGWIVLCSRERNLGRWITRVIGLSPRISGHELGERLAPDSEGAMRKARFTEEQMVAVIREADREPAFGVPFIAGGCERRSLYCGTHRVRKSPSKKSGRCGKHIWDLRCAEPQPRG